MFVLLDEAIEELADVVDHFSGWDSLLPSRYVLLIALTDAGFRVISFDYRGYGLSDVPPTKATFSDVLNDLLVVIDSLGLPKDFDLHMVLFLIWGSYLFQQVGILLVFLVGKDFGARPAHFFSVLYPERVLGVVTLGVPYAPLPSWFTEEDLATYGALYEKSGFQPALQIPYRSFDEVFNLPREVSEVIAKRGTVCDFWQLFKALISSKARVISCAPCSQCLIHVLHMEKPHRQKGHVQRKGFSGEEGDSLVLRSHHSDHFTFLLGQNLSYDLNCSMHGGLIVDVGGDLIEVKNFWHMQTPRGWDDHRQMGLSPDPYSFNFT
ncbi:hypothetical protein Fmac_016511 [Flemingia macrophylla]|uniref:AB hydrolase-1 domain-containing protein n=1 Tax=Flemingia macrophylla TaxID=520843 RepID=A0ABD1MIF1_9FABA